MICPHIVNVSMLLGSILTWGWLWPYIDGKAGEWYPEGLKEHNFKGLFGYKVSSPCAHAHILRMFCPGVSASAWCPERAGTVHLDSELAQLSIKHWQHAQGYCL